MKKSKKRCYFMPGVIFVNLIISGILIYYRLYRCGLFNYSNNTKLIKQIKSAFIDFQDYNMDIYLTQVSFTFITISLVTILSDRSVTLYWKHLVEEILINPTFTCLYAFISYSFSTVFISTVAIIFKYNIVLYFSFCLDIIFLLLLTYTMLNVYFNRDKQKMKAEEYFRKLNNDIEKNKEERKLLISKLKEKTLQAFYNNDVNIVIENIEFYEKYLDYNDVEYLMYLIEPKNIEYAIHIIEGFTNRFNEELEKDKSNLDNALDRWNPITEITQKMINEIKNASGERLFETIMKCSRSIMVDYFSAIYDDNPEIDDTLNYKKFRHGVRQRIENRKTGNYNSGDNLVEYKNTKGADGSEMIDLRVDANIDILKNIIPKSELNITRNNNYANDFHNSLKKSPVYTVLSLVEKAVKNKNYKYLTIFVSVYTQFPIFGFLYCLDEDYNNNIIYKNTIEKLQTLKESNILNEDWKDLYNNIFENQCENKKWTS